MMTNESTKTRDAASVNANLSVFVESLPDPGYAIPVRFGPSDCPDQQPDPCCDVDGCSRSADVTCDGRSWCSWHWAEHRFALRSKCIKPTAKAG